MVRRRSIEIPGFDHGGLPIPAASIVDNILFSGGVAGVDTNTGKIPEDVESQVHYTFTLIKRIIEAAGGTTCDIVKVTLYVKDRSFRSLIDKQWVSMFPDEESRPSRHTIVYEHLPANALLQAEFYAVLE